MAEASRSSCEDRAGYQGPIDVLLVGDSITIQWGESWKKQFPDLKAINIGIGGDKTQNVLWRLIVALKDFSRRSSCS